MLSLEENEKAERKKIKRRKKYTCTFCGQKCISAGEMKIHLKNIGWVPVQYFDSFFIEEENLNVTVLMEL